MTSSLVGSEMCIRDSERRGDKGDQAHVEQKSLHSLQGWHSAHLHQRQRSCLLYTSDAADDM
eukprot:12675285-Prorocentrum_lima.AAC.1